MVKGESGELHDMTYGEQEDFRVMLEGMIRGAITDATYHMESKTLDNGKRKVYIELHLEVE